jgi:hypothetical protein
MSARPIPYALDARSAAPINDLRIMPRNRSRPSMSLVLCQARRAISVAAGADLRGVGASHCAGAALRKKVQRATLCVCLEGDRCLSSRCLTRSTF